MKIRAIQFNPALGNVAKNLEFHVEKIEEAAADKKELVIFPELSLSGYHMKDIIFDASMTPGDKIFERFKTLSRIIDIVIGTPFEDPVGIIYNSALYFSKGELLHNHRKIQLPNFGMFEEEMIFKAGDRLRSFKVGDFTVGMIICREILFPAVSYLYLLQGVDFLIGISNSPFRGMSKEHGFSSLKLWERMGEVFSMHYHQNYIFVNRTGFEDGIGFGGGSFYAAPGQGLVKKAPFFDEYVLDFEIDKEAVRRARIGANYFRDDKPDVIFNELKRLLNA
jgi:predicted amidohydrolase